MSSETKSTVNVQGISTLGLLGVVFITLKLLGVITWSWWWVTAPFWAGPAALLVVAVGVLVAVAVVALAKTLIDRRKAKRSTNRSPWLD